MRHTEMSLKIPTGNNGTSPGASRLPIAKLVQPYIKNYIVSNDLEPGDSLPSEAELADALQVSRGSVRESVKALEALGVIEVRHGKGLYVRSLNLDAALEVLSYSLDVKVGTVHELYRIRKWLETAVIDEVVTRIDASTLDNLDQLLEDWEASIPLGTWPQYDRKFHRALNSVLQNQTLLLMLDAFWTVFDNATDETVKSTPDPRTTLEDHRRILEAVRRGDREAAREALAESYFSFEDRYRTAAHLEGQSDFVMQSQT